MPDYDVEGMALHSPLGIVSMQSGAEQCVWAISPPGAKTVALEFTRFRMKFAANFVSVYDGLTTESQLLTKLTGYLLPSSITATTGTMLVVVEMGESNERTDGFEAIYRADNAVPGAVPSKETFGSRCVASRRSVSEACRVCILATVSYVCGSDCVTAHLHLAVGSASAEALPPPSQCLAALAKRLATEQAVRLQRAILQARPFALTSGNTTAGVLLNDVYVPDNDATSLGTQMLVGLDSQFRLRLCNKTHLVFAASIVEALQCNGLAWIDLRTGHAHTQSAATVFPWTLLAGLSECAEALMMPMVSDTTLTFGREVPSSTVACWLSRFFGPWVAPAKEAPTLVQLTDGLQVIDLVSDLVIRDGHRVHIAGSKNRIRMGNHQLRVDAGGDLTLHQLVISDSIGPSAISVHGKVLIRNCSFLDCRGSMNNIRMVPTVTLMSAGAALTVQAGVIELIDSGFHRNVVAGNGQVEGGALFLCRGSKASITSTDFVENLAVGSKDVGGGAIAVWNSTVVIVQSKISQNRCQGGISTYGAGIYSYDSTLHITAMDMVENVVDTDGRYSNGGTSVFMDIGECARPCFQSVYCRRNLCLLQEEFMRPKRNCRWSTAGCYAT